MKRWVSKQIGFPVWQKSFYDHIIRNEHEYQQILTVIRRCGWMERIRYVSESHANPIP